MTDTDPRCQKCGHPRSNHPYRHMFVGPSKPDIVGIRADLVTPLDDPLVAALVEAAKAAEAVLAQYYVGNRAIAKRKLRKALSALEENK